MVYSLTYRRPPHVVDSTTSSLNGDRRTKSVDESISSGSTGVSRGIPDALSFDRIIAGGTCPVSHLHWYKPHFALELGGQSAFPAFSESDGRKRDCI
jgi:hypothetical protein